MRRALVVRRPSTLIAFWLTLGVLFTLAACGQGSGGAHGTLTGDVVAGPTCPVERLDNPCPPKPVANREVTVALSDGTTAATMTTDASGRFSVQIAPGRYIVHVKTGPGMVGMRQATAGDVTVYANQTSTIHIELDTGMR